MSEDVLRSPGIFVLGPQGARWAKAVAEGVGGFLGLAVGIAIAAVFGFGVAAASVISAVVSSYLGVLIGYWVARKRASRGVATSPLKEELGYVAVLPESVVLFAAETRGWVKTKPKRTDAVLATMPRSSTKTARLVKRGELEITFVDGSSWTFDVIHAPQRGSNYNVQEVISALGGSPTPFPKAPPGWYPDPHGRCEVRYWDGWIWIPHVSSGGHIQNDHAHPARNRPGPRRGRVGDAHIDAIRGSRPGRARACLPMIWVVGGDDRRHDAFWCDFG